MYPLAYKRNLSFSPVRTCLVAAFVLAFASFSFAQAYQLAFTTSPGLPSNLASGANVGTPQVTVEDMSGSPVDFTGQSVTLTLKGPGVSETYTNSDITGASYTTFSTVGTVELKKSGLYTLTASSSGLLSTNQVVGVNVPMMPPQNTTYTGMFYGVYTDDPYQTGVQNDPTPIETDAGRTLAIDNHYIAWTDLGDKFGTGFVNEAPWTRSGSDPFSFGDDDLTQGRIVLISWKCDNNLYTTYSDQSSDYYISQGQENSTIDAAAAKIQAYGAPVFVRWNWEMDIATSGADCQNIGTGGNTQAVGEADFILAWDYIRSRFAQDGVTNVIWVWNPLQWAPGYYPGNKNVDWIGFDPYSQVEETPDPTLAEDTFWDDYNHVGAGGLDPEYKPILLGETGTPNGNPADDNPHDYNDQPDFFAQIPQQFEQGDGDTDNPNGFADILGLTYFNANGPGPGEQVELIEPTSDGLTAYKNMVNSVTNPYFSAMNVVKSKFPYSTLYNPDGETVFYPFDTYIHFAIANLQGSSFALSVTVNAIDIAGGPVTPNGTVTVNYSPDSYVTLTLQSSVTGVSSTYTGTFTGLPSGQRSLVAIYTPGTDDPNPAGQSQAFQVTVN